MLPFLYLLFVPISCNLCEEVTLPHCCVWKKSLPRVMANVQSRHWQLHGGAEGSTGGTAQARGKERSARGILPRVLRLGAWCHTCTAIFSALVCHVSQGPLSQTVLSGSAHCSDLFFAPGCQTMLQGRKGSRAQAQVCDCTLPKTMAATAASVATSAIDMAENACTKVYLCYQNIEHGVKTSDDSWG